MKIPFFVGLLLTGLILSNASCNYDSNSANTANRAANTANVSNGSNTGTAANPAATDADVKKLLNDLAAVLAKNDADAAAKFYSDDYHLVTPAGVDQTKAERLAEMRSGATKFDTFAYENVNVRTYGDTAVAIATVKATGKVANQPRVTDMRATLVLKKMADGWKVVSGQATPITGAASTTANTAGNGSNMANKADTNSAGNANRY